MNKTYYAIKNVDTGEYWSSILGDFAAYLWPGDLYTELERARDFAYFLEDRCENAFTCIEAFTIQSAGIMEKE